MLLPSGTPLLLPLPQLGTETIPAEKALMQEDRGPESSDTTPAPSAPEKQTR